MPRNTIHLKVIVALLAWFAVAVAPLALAVDIDVKSGGFRQTKIDIQSFSGEEVLPFNVSEIVHSDLRRAGLFRPTLTGHVGEPDLAKLRGKAIEHVLIGFVEKLPNSNKFRVTFKLLDTITEQSLGAFAYRFSKDQTRVASHAISDWVHEQVFNEPGGFSSKIAYVVKNKNDNFELKVADYDGHDSQAVVSSTEPIISPAWSPDGNSLLYVSFEQDKPIIYHQSLLTGSRKVIMNFKGSNSAPTMSPNQRAVAAALTKDGPTQIYIMATDTGETRRLRESFGIDTEPTFSPDGRQIAFVSDSAGGPQIYMKDLEEESRAQRLTFDSPYSVSPQFSHDGSLLVFVRRDKRGFNLALLDVADKSTETLTAIRLADSPSFSPNSRIVLYKDETKPRVLYTVSVHGKIRQVTEFQENGEIKDPIWGPATSGWY